MSDPATPSAPTPAGDDRNLVRVDEKSAALGFEERLHLFWEKNSRIVMALIAVVLFAIVAKGGWEYLAAEREKDVERAYAAATTPAQLKTFAAANPDHPLAGVALLRNADDAYAAGNFAEAAALYDQSAAALKTGPLAARAQIGAAMAKLQSGRETDGVAGLKAISSNASAIKAYRAAAAFHLASFAWAKNNAADLKTYTEQLLQIDGNSPWAQRVLQLRLNGPAEAAAAPTATPAAPAITLPPAGK